ncbi:MAG: transketolase [Pseudomonadota bacterium]|nr:transketolase [Pseudomonadota bacterium]
MNKKDLSNAIRFLSIDAVEKAKSGHPGAPMGMADVANVLWNNFLQHNPNNPNWINRDRFVLSNGHGSMLLYSLLHLTGYKLTIKDIKNFRQLHSKTPGHPEHDITPGVETTTGPLGQGLANAVGMAMAEKILAGEFNKPKHEIINHYTYVFAGDGCLMEGISHEACSLAGTLGLNKLIVIYDMNGISIDGDIELWFTENIKKRFEAYNWNVIDNVDGHNFEKITKSIVAAKRERNRPTIICAKTKIGFGSPNKEGTGSVHGAPLGQEEVNLTRKKLSWPHKPFHIPNDIYKSWDFRKKGEHLEKKWNEKYTKYKKQFPKDSLELSRRLRNKLPNVLNKEVSKLINNKNKPMATRKSSQVVLESIGKYLPELVGGSADLKDSNLVYWSSSKAITKKNFSGKYIYYGVREFGMSAISNGLYLHGGFRPYASTFLIFSEYAKNAIRMSALMKLPIIYVFTHDSIGLGEDGPTHQAVEQLTSLRLIPGMDVWRPADLCETALAWKYSLMNKSGPSSIVLTRQSLPEIIRTSDQKQSISKGGYTIFENHKNPDVIMIATGSELNITIDAARKLSEEKIKVRVVSMPCADIFLKQDSKYREKVLPHNFVNILSVEAGVGDFWYQFIGRSGSSLNMNSFGLSAPGSEAMEFFGFTKNNIVKEAKKLIKKNRRRK